MASDTNKKLLLLYILNVIKEYSDFDHQLSQAEIISHVKKSYGMDCERKAVSRNIDFLNDFGYDIVHGDKGYYLAEREFDQSEIIYLVDSVFSNRAIPAKNSTELVKKLAGFSSKYERKSYKHLFKPCDGGVENRQFFYSIDALSRAIDEGKQVSFGYLSFQTENGVVKEVKKTHVVNPYFMVNSRGKYYLVCNKLGKGTVGSYKIENIVDVEITENAVIPITYFDGFKKGLDEASYINEHIYMFGGEVSNSEIELLSDKAIGVVYEWFGKNARIVYSGGKLVAHIKAEEQALCYWALQYGELVVIKSPQSVVDKISGIVKSLSGAYLK